MNMSLGFGPGGINCDDVLSELFVYLDRETDEPTRQRIRNHLDECSPCLRRYGLEADVKSLIARTCGTETAPQELHTRIRVRITEISIETSRREYRPE